MLGSHEEGFGCVACTSGVVWVRHPSFSIISVIWRKAEVTQLGKPRGRLEIRGKEAQPSPPACPEILHHNKV